MPNPLNIFRHRPRFGINSARPYDIAKELGIQYSGDCNLEHGGMFFDVADWKENGYSNAVEVYVSDSAVFICRGTINRCDDMAEVLRSSGLTIDEDTGDIVDEHSGNIIAEKDSAAFRLVEIEATKSTWGIEPQTEGDNRACKLVEIYRLPGEHSENCSDYFIDQGKRIKLDDLQGYVLTQYVIGHLTREENRKP